MRERERGRERERESFVLFGDIESSPDRTWRNPGKTAARGGGKRVGSIEENVR